MFSDDLKQIKEKENSLLDITSSYEEILDDLTEDEKSMNFVNEEGDAFVNAEINKAAKNKNLEPETLEKVKNVAKLISEEKELKKEIKKLSAQLENKTKKRIEDLKDTDVIELLKDKWIKPIIAGLSVIPQRIITSLASKMDSLAKKYETTFADVEKEIKETEESLKLLINELTGSEEDMLGLEEFKKFLGGN